MLYLLLTIIAVGVLLASSEGKSLLNYICLGLGIIGAVYVGFWIIVGLVALLTSLYHSGFVQTYLVDDPFWHPFFWLILIIYSLLGLMKLLNHFGFLDKKAN